MRYRFITIVAASLLSACSRGAEPAVSDAWVRVAAVPGRPAAAYFVLHGGAADARLVQVSAPGVKRIELHGSRMTANGMATMDALANVPVAARATVAFAPGGRHAMLFDVPAGVAPGGTLPLTFRFADGRTVAAAAPVVGAGESGPR